MHVTNTSFKRCGLSGQRAIIPSIHLRLQTWKLGGPYTKTVISDRALNPRTSDYMHAQIYPTHSLPYRSLNTHDCVSSHSSTSIVKFADVTVVLSLISNNNETAYLDEVERLTSWCQDNCLSLNVSKTKELIVHFRKRQQRPYTPLMISGTPVERVGSFKYIDVNISEDLTWTAHIQTQVKKARQRLYHLRQLRKFRVSLAILKTFYSGAIESVLTVWHGNASNQDCKALQRVMRLAERISGSALPSLQDIYLKCCKSRAVKITKDSNHPGNHLFILLPSGKCFRSTMAKTERLRRSFFPQAIRLLNSSS